MVLVLLQVRWFLDVSVMISVVFLRRRWASHSQDAWAVMASGSGSFSFPGIRIETQPVEIQKDNSDRLQSPQIPRHNIWPPVRGRPGEKMSTPPPLPKHQPWFCPKLQSHQLLLLCPKYSSITSCISEFSHLFLKTVGLYVSLLKLLNPPSSRQLKQEGPKTENN